MATVPSLRQQLGSTSTCQMNSLLVIKTTIAAIALLCAFTPYGLLFKLMVQDDSLVSIGDARVETAQQRIASSRILPFDRVVIDASHLNGSYYLPEALIPPDSDGNECCPMASSTSNNKKQCANICGTPRACTDSMYPFRNEEEKLFLSPRENMTTSKGYYALRNKCHEKNGLLHPPFQWCQQWLSTETKGSITKQSTIDYAALSQYNSQDIDPYKADLPPPGCSYFSHGGGSGSYQNLLLFPSSKLAFCGIPKNSITQWLQFLRFTLGAKDYLSHPHGKEDVKLFRFDSIKEDAQLDILNGAFIAFLLIDCVLYPSETNSRPKQIQSGSLLYS